MEGDQNFLKVKKLIFSIFIFLISISYSFSKNLNFSKIVDLDDPWGSTFINKKKCLFQKKVEKLN